MKTTWTFALVSASLLFASAATAQELQISIGIRETGGTGPIGADGGTTGGIEFVNVDGQTLTADGSWQLFTFTPAVDTLTPFAGVTANGILDNEWGVLEQIRFRNTADGATAYRVWIDDLSNTNSAGTVSLDFEGIPVGTEVVFQEPSLSGSTLSNLIISNFDSAAVDDSMAFAGSQSYRVEFEFVDDDPSRWLRLTSFNADNLPNVAVHLREPGVGVQPTISFYAKAVVVPEPSTAIALLLAAAGSIVPLRRRIAQHRAF
jgi:hypothetical protein